MVKFQKKLYLLEISILLIKLYLYSAPAILQVVFILNAECFIQAMKEIS